MKRHDTLVQTAKFSIDQVHSDTSVPANTTAASLKDIRDHIDVLIDAVQGDTIDDADEG